MKHLRVWGGYWGAKFSVWGGYSPTLEPPLEWAYHTFENLFPFVCQTSQGIESRITFHNFLCYYVKVIQTETKTVFYIRIDKRMIILIVHRE